MGIPIPPPAPPCPPPPPPTSISRQSVATGKASSESQSLFDPEWESIHHIPHRFLVTQKYLHATVEGRPNIWQLARLQREHCNDSLNGSPISVIEELLSEQAFIVSFCTHRESKRGRLSSSFSMSTSSTRRASSLIDTHRSTMLGILLSRLKHASPTEIIKSLVKSTSALDEAKLNELIKCLPTDQELASIQGAEQVTSPPDKWMLEASLIGGMEWMLKTSSFRQSLQPDGSRQVNRLIRDMDKLINVLQKLMNSDSLVDLVLHLDRLYELANVRFGPVTSSINVQHVLRMDTLDAVLKDDNTKPLLDFVALNGKSGLGAKLVSQLPFEHELPEGGADIDTVKMEISDLLDNWSWIVETKAALDENETRTVHPGPPIIFKLYHDQKEAFLGHGQVEHLVNHLKSAFQQLNELWSLTTNYLNISQDKAYIEVGGNDGTNSSSSSSTNCIRRLVISLQSIAQHFARIEREQGNDRDNTKEEEPHEKDQESPSRSPSANQSSIREDEKEAAMSAIYTANLY